jgi:hypothetical protein
MTDGRKTRGVPAHPSAIAFHEAGHAVMGWHLGAMFRSVSIRGGPHCRGWVWFCEDLAARDPTQGSDWEHAALIYLAGPLAAWPHERRFRALSARRDLERAYDLVERACRSATQAREQWGQLRERAWNVLGREDLWQAVSALARALLRWGTLTGREARAVISAACEHPGTGRRRTISTPRAGARRPVPNQAVRAVPGSLPAPSPQRSDGPHAKARAARYAGRAAPRRRAPPPA